MAQTGSPPSISWSFASQMNLRDEAQAKSRTFSAAKVQVLVPSGAVLSLASASSRVTIRTGVSDVSARARRSRQTGRRTSSGFWRTPVDATMWSSGAVMLTT